MSAIDQDLYDLVCEAHGRSALRGNLSGEALRLATIGSGDYVKAICAALMTVGGKHAPLLQTYDVLSAPDPALVAVGLLRDGARVPGWGNSFVKREPDPLWAEVEARLRSHHSDLWRRIERVTAGLHGRGKLLFPNPSCYTAAAGMVCKIPRPALPMMFVVGRLPAWTDEFIRLSQGGGQ